VRATFASALLEIAERDPRVLLLTGDLGYTVLEPFAARFPDRFFNVGVAEQNMIGLATGLAEAGFVPFVYSIATFASLRPYELIRNGPVSHRLDVRIVGVGGGFEYGHQGVSHYALEDIGILRLQPGLRIVVPADASQARAALDATWNLRGPTYYRLGKDDRLEVPELAGRFELGRAETILEGDDVLLVAMGAIAGEVAAAGRALREQGIRATALVVSSLNPEPRDDLIEALSRFRVALTVEAHYAVGGLGSLVSEIVAERSLGCRVISCGVRGRPEGRTGTQAYLEDHHGIGRHAIVRAARDAVSAGR